MKSFAFSVFQNPQTRPQFLALANFFACLQCEKPRDFAFILSVLKSVQRWWLWWIRCIGHHKIFMDVIGERGRKIETRFHMSVDNLLPKFKRKTSSFLTANYPAIFSLILCYFWSHYSFEGWTLKRFLSHWYRSQKHLVLLDKIIKMEHFCLLI